MDNDKIIEVWYFTETVEGIAEIKDFLDCKYEVENIGFDNWIKKNGLEEDFKAWIKRNGVDYK